MQMEVHVEDQQVVIEEEEIHQEVEEVQLQDIDQLPHVGMLLNL